MERISVLIVNYNYGKFIRECIESVFAQTVDAELEVIVVDDGSTDNSVEVISGFPQVKCVRQDHLGVSAARNRAVAEATGDYLAFIDADDMWKSGKLELQLRYLKDHPQCPVIFTAYENFIQPPLTGDEDWVKRCIAFAKTDRNCLPTALFRRYTAERLGAFDNELNRCEDTDWTGRMAEKGIEGEYLPESLYLRRLHGANLMNRTARETAKEIMGVNMRKVRANVRLDARRAQFLPEGVSFVLRAENNDTMVSEYAESVRCAAKELSVPCEMVFIDACSCGSSGANAKNGEAAFNAGIIKSRYSCVFFLEYPKPVTPHMLKSMHDALYERSERLAVFSSDEFECGSMSFSLVKKEAFRKIGLFDDNDSASWLDRLKAGSYDYCVVNCQ